MKKIVLFLLSIFFCVTSVDARVALRKYSLKSSCPKETPFGDEGAYHCVDCDDLIALTVLEGHEDDFDICFNRETIETRSGQLKSRLRKCPPSAPIRNSRDNCISCDTTDIVFSNKDECDKCSNRTYIEDSRYSSGVCELKTCPSDKPLKNNYECISCDVEALELSIDEITCQKCPNTYKWYQEKCIPIRYRSYDGQPLLIDLAKSAHWVDYSVHRIYSGIGCGVIDSIITTKENCDNCPNREYVDGKCVLKQDSKKKGK